MTDNIDKNEIRKAIDRLQLEHPCHFAFDATKFDSTDSIDVVKRVIDNVMESIRDDADIHIICEFAKLYLDGVKPTIEPKRPHGEWIPVSERLPEEHGYYLVTTDGSHNDVIDIAEFGTYKSLVWGWNKASKIIAWMPLPEPYQKEGEAE